MSKDKNEKNITDGISFFTENNLFKKKENIYFIKVFGLSIILFFISGGLYYLLSLIASVLIINGYNEAKKENKQ